MLEPTIPQGATPIGVIHAEETRMFAHGGECLRLSHCADGDEWTAAELQHEWLYYHAFEYAGRFADECGADSAYDATEVSPR